CPSSPPPSRTAVATEASNLSYPYQLPFLAASRREATTSRLSRTRKTSLLSGKASRISGALMDPLGSLTMRWCLGAMFGNLDRPTSRN
ncbi:MAG: hypothetical protein AVDCRST_MAG93-244, partial [uncultured Chloroflexia bacterium]